MNKKEGKVYELAIIGGGAAGLYLANKLNNTKDLILIENGHINKFNRNNKNLKFIMNKNTKHKLNTDQVSGMGGNTNIWGGQLLPFTKNDINKKNGWPLEWEEISEIYKSLTRELLNENIKFYSQEYIENSTKTKIVESNQIEFNVHLS